MKKGDEEKQNQSKNKINYANIRPAGPAPTTQTSELCRDPLVSRRLAGPWPLTSPLVSPLVLPFCRTPSISSTIMAPIDRPFRPCSCELYVGRFY